MTVGCNVADVIINIIISCLEATGPSNPVPWPVRLGGTAYLLCSPLHSELSSIREALWSVYNPKHDNWTSILGIDRSNYQARWHIKSFGNDSRYTLYGPSYIFLKLGKVTEEDIGTEHRYKEKILQFRDFREVNYVTAVFFKTVQDRSNSTQSWITFLFKIRQHGPEYSHK